MMRSQRTSSQLLRDDVGDGQVQNDSLERAYRRRNPVSNTCSVGVSGCGSFSQCATSAMQMNLLLRYNNMAAGLKSTAPFLHISSMINEPSVPSRDPAFLRSRSRILDDHPLLRSLVKLVASHRRFVHILLSPPHPLR